MLYIRLFHGRSNPEQDLDDWGADGPVFGPYKFVHTTYSWHVVLGSQDKDWDELYVYEDMLFYDDMYYGDWSVISEEIFAKSGLTVTGFEQEKATLPKKENQ